MSISGFVIGLVACIGVLSSFLFPFLSQFIPYDWYHWFNLPVALFGLTLSILGLISRKQLIFALSGLMLNILSIVIGLIKLL
jgi:hypothetical protein